MKKTLFNFRITPQLLALITQLAESRHDGDKTAMVTDLILLGLEALKEGASIPVRHEPSYSCDADVESRILERLQASLVPIQEKLAQLEASLGELAA